MMVWCGKGRIFLVGFIAERSLEVRFLGPTIREDRFSIAARGGGGAFHDVALLKTLELWGKPGRAFFLHARKDFR
jgi:hypothetical protein